MGDLAHLAWRTFGVFLDPFVGYHGYVFETAKGGLEALQISDEELLDMLRAQPSLRAPLLGHAARYKLKRLLAPKVTRIVQQDDHNRKRRGSMMLEYRGQEFAVRCVSLQSDSILEVERGVRAKFQCDGSDKRDVALPDGTKIKTTCALAASFDVLAVSLFAVLGTWDFAFAPAAALERTRSKKLPVTQRQFLLATTHTISLPLTSPYHASIFSVLDSLVADNGCER